MPRTLFERIRGERLNSSGDTGMMQVKTVSRNSFFFYCLPKALSIKGRHEKNLKDDTHLRGSCFYLRALLTLSFLPLTGVVSIA